MFNKVALCVIFIAFVHFEMSEGYNADDPTELDRLIKETDEQIKESELKLKEFSKTIVKASRPNIYAIFKKEVMLSDAQTIASDVLNHYSDPTDISIDIRKRFKKKYNLYNWHCVVGHDLGFDFANNVKNHIQFEVRGFKIVLFALSRGKIN